MVRLLTATGSNTVLGMCAALATSGCFLVEDYRVAPRQSGPSVVAPPLSRPSSSVDPVGEVDAAAPAPSAPEVEDTGVPGQPDPTVVTEPSSVSLAPTESLSAATEPSSSAALPPDPTAAAPTDSSPVTTADVAPDAGPPPVASSSPPPECVEGSTYDATLAACIETCGADEVQGPHGRCYWFTRQTSYWGQAVTKCTDRGAGWNLISIRDAEEQAFIVPRLDPTQGGPQVDTWIGASYNANTDTWSWLDDGTEFWTAGEFGHAVDDAFHIWGTGEPSQANDEVRARYHPYNGSWGWSDTDTSVAFAVACKGPGPDELIAGPANSTGTPNPGNTWGPPGGSSSGRGR